MSRHDVTEKQLPVRAGSASTVPILPAASVIVLRRPFEVLLLRRSDRSTFVPGAWLFPGGAIEEQDRVLAQGELQVARVAAIRELFEETGLWPGGALSDVSLARKRLLTREITIADVAAGGPLPVDNLVWTSRWVTPEGVPKRFDTWFFLVEMGADADVVPDQLELVEFRWLTPAAALELEKEGSLSMLFPTIRNLQALTAHEDIDSLLSARNNAVIHTTRPVLTILDGKRTIQLPEEDT